MSSAAFPSLFPSDVISSMIKSLRGLGQSLVGDDSLTLLRTLCTQEVLAGPVLSDSEMDALVWLVWLYYNGTSGLLVDRRLSSHTTVVVAAIQSLLSQRIYGTHLIITNQVNTWVTSLEEGAPTVQIKPMLGGKLERKSVRHSVAAVHKAALLAQSKDSSPSDVCEGGCVVLITPSAFLHEPSLQTFPWDFFVVDEAVNNSELRLNHMKYVAKVTLIQQTDRRNLIRAALDVTGRVFQTTPTVELEDIDEFADVMRPFLFSFLVNTPPLLYVCISCPSSSLQRELYDQCGQKRPMERRYSTQARHVQLSKVCSHPYLLDKYLPDGLRDEGSGDKELAKTLVEASGKLNTLHRLLLSVIAGSRVLVCSQNTRMLDLIDMSLRLSNTFYGTSYNYTRSERPDDPLSTIYLQATKHVSSLVGFDWVVLYDSEADVGGDIHLIGYGTPSTKFIRLVAPGSIDEAVLAATSQSLESANLEIRWGDCAPTDASKAYIKGDILNAVDTLTSTLALGVQSPNLPLLSVDELRQLLL